MTVKELITLLQNLPAAEQDLQVHYAPYIGVAGGSPLIGSAQAVTAPDNPGPESDTNPIVTKVVLCQILK